MLEKVNDLEVVQTGQTLTAHGGEILDGPDALGALTGHVQSQFVNRVVSVRCWVLASDGASHDVPPDVDTRGSDHRWSFINDSSKSVAASLSA